MKIVHICTMLDGGAGLCARRIAKATEMQGAEVRFLVMRGHKDEHTDVVEEPRYLSGFWPVRMCQRLVRWLGWWPRATRVSRAIRREMARGGVGTVSSPVTDYKNIADHPFVCEADIVHLHWVGGFLDYESFFRKCRKPVVWTLHDENAGLGCFHYTSWKEQSGKGAQQLDDRLTAIKDRAYRQHGNITLVAISQMMSRFIAENPILGHLPQRLIHNGIDGKDFKPVDKKVVREALGIPQEARVYLFSAIDINDNRKGLKALIAALETMDQPHAMLVCLGGYRFLPTHGSALQLRLEGYVANSRLLSLYYSAADYFVMPSFQEAFAQTPLEAMACGTPVVAFPCSGTRELINERNGIVCSDFTVEALVDGFGKAIAREYHPEEIREDVLRHFSYDRIAQEYIHLYNSLLT